jgi:hypothetical protein
MCESTSTIFSMLFGKISGEVTRFSTARITPSGVLIPIAVEPSFKIKQKVGDFQSKSFFNFYFCTLMASKAYSTWKSLPSGENVFTP